MHAKETYHTEAAPSSPTRFGPKRPIPRETLIALYYNQGLSASRAGKQLGHSASSVLRYLRHYGLSPRPGPPGKKGRDNPNWKGGRRLRADGYVMLRMPTHPRASGHGEVLEHIAIWEEANGASVPPGFVIHHLNGIKSDNRPENLSAIPVRSHDKHHSKRLVNNHSACLIRALRKRIRILEGKLTQLPLPTFADGTGSTGFEATSSVSPAQPPRHEGGAVLSAPPSTSRGPV